MIGNSPYTALFVPATKPERFLKAAASGADAIVIDLEDAVAPEDRIAARQAIATFMKTRHDFACNVFIRINAVGTGDHIADLELLDWLPAMAGIMLAKAEQPLDAIALTRRFPGRTKIGLVETPRGVEFARILALLFDRIAFGSIDYANAIGAAHKDRPLLAARSELVFSCALAGKPAPLDGVTTAISDRALIVAEARASYELGFRGKLLIHPKQVSAALHGLGPDPSEVDEAHRILASVAGGAAGFEGKMVDAPVLEAARRKIALAKEIERRVTSIASA